MSSNRAVKRRPPNDGFILKKTRHGRRKPAAVSTTPSAPNAARSTRNQRRRRAKAGKQQQQPQPQPQQRQRQRQRERDEKESEFDDVSRVADDIQAYYPQLTNRRVLESAIKQLQLRSFDPTNVQILDIIANIQTQSLLYGQGDVDADGDGTVSRDSDDDDDDDDDDDEEDEEEAAAHGAESVPEIAPGLGKFGIEPVRFEIPQQSLQEETAVATLKRAIMRRFVTVAPQRRDRYVMVVDRRGDGDSGDGDDGDGGDDEKKKSADKDSASTSKKGSDKIWIYSPNCEQDEKQNSENGPSYHRLHQDYVEESLLYKTLKCLIPSARVRMDPHYGCKQQDVITLSFHVLRKDLIKCYLFINGGGARFEVPDLIKLLPGFFVKSSSESNNTLLSRATVEQNFGLKLQDEQFEGWYKRTTTKMTN